MEIKRVQDIVKGRSREGIACLVFFFDASSITSVSPRTYLIYIRLDLLDFLYLCCGYGPQFRPPSD